MRKISWFFVLVLTLSLVLAACGGGSGEDSEDGTDDEGSGGEEGTEESGGDSGGSGEGGTEAGEDWVENITLLTGGEAGVYFPLGVALADIIDANVDGVTATGVSSGASVTNAEQLNNGEAQLALVQNDIAYFGVEGINMFDSPLENYSGMFTIYPETIQLVTVEGTGIESVSDLEGMRVALGDVGSGTEANATQILEAHGLSVEDINAQSLDFADASTNLQDGNIDAAFVTAGTPTGAIQELSASADVRLVNMETDAIDSLMEEYNYYVQEDIPSDAYENFDSETTTVAVQAMMIGSNDIPEDQMHEITRVIFENLDEVANAHVRGEELSMDTAEDGMSIDLHPGVQSYYDERQ